MKRTSKKVSNKVAMQDNVVKETDELQITLHPESLASIVEDLKAKGYSDDAIVLEIEKIKAQILEDFKERQANGLLEEIYDDVEYSDTGEFPNNHCGVTMH